MLMVIVTRFHLYTAVAVAAPAVCVKRLLGARLGMRVCTAALATSEGSTEPKAVADSCLEAAWGKGNV